MVERFVGTWQTVASENFDEFLKEIGMGMAMRKAACMVKPEMTVSVDAQDLITLTMKTSFKTKEFQFKLNEPFEGTSANDKTATIVVTLEGGKLVQKQTCEGRETTIEREIVDGKLIMTCKSGNVVATRTFQKPSRPPPKKPRPLHRQIIEAADMVEQFVGSWKMVSSENFDDFLKAMGVGFAIRQIASRTKPSLIVTLDQGIICLKMLSSFKTTEVKFKLNQAFDETTADGRNTTNIVTLENGKLVQSQSWDGKETTIEREIVDGKLVTKCKIGNVVAVRTFQREA
ncbi:uncharacterized protein LOC130376277 [Gadus chalcogrammus]|uniref:uncharacterized protein LOC130376277 n=1 Tax=Gadus chalcogrammus TaxID=1042646 RepID=UPI0024C48D9A|nr:uncharacterized protein LOC130376277 [Gadus chalcogrammus]